VICGLHKAYKSLMRVD